MLKHPSVQSFLLSNSFAFKCILKPFFPLLPPNKFVSRKPAEFRVFMSNSFSMGQESHVGFAFLGIIYRLVLSHFPTSCYAISWAAPPRTVPDIRHNSDRASRKQTAQLSRMTGTSCRQYIWKWLQLKKKHTTFVSGSFNCFSLKTLQEPHWY